MTDNLAPAVAEPVTAALPDDAGGSERGIEHKTPEPEPEPPKAKSVSDSVKEALDKAEADEAAEAAKPKVEKPKAEPEAKPVAEKQPNVAAEKPDMAAGQEGGDKPPSEGKQVNAPARLLPKAREVWANTPRAVQAEFERFEREAEAERETHREARQFHEELREYRDMAKQVGTSVPVALKRYVEFDKQISADFGRGMAAIAQDQGKSPIDAVASLIRGFGSTPEQFAKHVLGNPQMYQAPQGQQQPQAQQRPANDPLLQEVQALKQHIQEQEHERAKERVVSDIIAPFEAEHPRFSELQEDIAKLLKTDIVPQSLSPAERLEVAYDMAERLKPSPRQPQSAFADPDDAEAGRPAVGRKSIGGAPGNGSIPSSKSPKTLSVKDSVMAAMRQHGVA